LKIRREIADLKSSGQDGEWGLFPYPLKA